MRKYMTVAVVAVILLTIASPSRTQASNGFSIYRDLLNRMDEGEPGPAIPDHNVVSAASHRSEGPGRSGRVAFQDQNKSATGSLESASLSVPIPPNIQVSTSGVTSGATLPVTDFSEVMVALDPTDPNHLLGASKFFYDSPNYGFYSGVFESYDGGFTWTQLQPIGVESYTLTSDPVTTFDDQGNGYFTLLTRGPSGYSGLDMLKKPSGGDWELPVLVDDTTQTDKQWIIGDQDPLGISPFPGHLYISWIDLGGGKAIMFSRSTDYNQNWDPPLELDRGADFRGPTPGVAPDGTVYVVFAQDAYDGSQGSLAFSKSIDGGTTFSPTQTITDLWGIPFRLDPPPSFRTPTSLPAFAVSPVNGNLYVAWADQRDGDPDIYFVRSTNGGESWDGLARLNDDPIGNGVDQFQPQIAVAPNGRIAVIWFDRRLKCPDLDWIPPANVGRANFCIDTFMTRSYDDGQTWSPSFRVSEQTWDWTLNLPVIDAQTGFIGDYQGVASNNGYDLPFWNATADLGENPNNYQQAFVARVPAPFFSLSPSKSVAPGTVFPGDVITYSLALRNAGPEHAQWVRLTDTVPMSTTFVPGSILYPQSAGTGGFDPAAGTITWTGTVATAMPVTLTFQVTVAAGQFRGDDAVIANTAIITDGTGSGYARTATTTVHVPPFILETSPGDGESRAPSSAPLVITFSEPVIANSLRYTVTPNPGGWVETWNPDRTVVTLDHNDWGFSQTYDVSVTARDLDDRSLVAGPVSNPWSFTVQGPPPYIVQTSPAHRAVDVPLTVTLAITFSEPVITNTFYYTFAPDAGQWTESWSSDRMVLNLDPGNLACLSTYDVSVAVQDADQLPLAQGPVPNPWTFTSRPCYVYLPVVLKPHP